MRVAALTMAYNEPVWAPVWARYYAGQLGTEHCLVLDHGSDDGSTDSLPVPVRRLPRSPVCEVSRAALVGEEVRRLLQRYDAVIHTDTDELLVADPAHHPTLAAAVADAADVTTGAGLDLQHLPGVERALDLAQPIGAQRQWVRFAASMCKPALVKRPVQWAPGFHCCDAPLQFGTLFLLHLRYADLGAGLRRLARTRAQAVASPAENQHQRVADAEFEGMMRAIASLPKVDAPLSADAPPLSDWLDRVRASRREREDQTYKLDLGLSGDVLWRLPDAVRRLF